MGRFIVKAGGDQNRKCAPRLFELTRAAPTVRALARLGSEEEMAVDGEASNMKC